VSDPAPFDEAEAEPRRRPRRPIGWSIMAIAVLVAVSAVLVYRRDGIVTSIDSRYVII
jgi:hypothetical protein